MHRSVTFSEIFSSTFSDDLNRYGDSYDQNVKAKFVAKIGIGLVEFILSTIFLCYGIIFSECLNLQACTVENGLWTTISYIAAWHIASPWSQHICEYFENNKYNVFRYSICTATVLLFLAFLIPGQILPFGIFGGALSNFISVQLKFVASEKFDMDLKTFGGNVQVARALNLLLMPHFSLLLTSYYDMFQIKLIFAAFLLNIIPAALIIKPRRAVQRQQEVSRYGTLPAFSNQIKEMMEFTNSVHVTEPNSPDLSSDSDDEENDDLIIPHLDKEDSYDINVVNEQLLQPMQLNPSNVQTYYSKIGVSILPEIPEELENEETYDDRDTINSRRISKISMRLEEINQVAKKALEGQNNLKNIQHAPYLDVEANQRGNDIAVKIIDINEDQKVNSEEQNIKDTRHFLYSESKASAKDNGVIESLNVNSLVTNQRLEHPEKIENIEYIHDYKEHRPRFLKELRSLKSSYCCGCSPYRKFIWRRRYRTVMDFCLDNLFKPLLVSFKDCHYYPTVISKVVISITTTMFFTLIPYVALKKNKGFQPEDATFLLSYVAFSWCLFLVLLPLVINFSKGRFRATFVCGLILVGTCMTLVSRKMTNDIMTISCLLYGFGYGIIGFTENMVYTSFVGARKWDMIQGTLETTTGIFVILTYYIIYRYNLDISILLLVALICYYVNALLWIVAPILKDIIIFCSKYYRKRDHQQIVM